MAPALAADNLAIEHWTQPNGARVYLLPQSQASDLQIQVDFDAGSRRDPQGQPGLAVLGAALATAGIRAQGDDPALNVNAVQMAWMRLNSELNTQVDADRFSYILRITDADAQRQTEAAALLGRQIAEPAFAGSVWLQAKPYFIRQVNGESTRRFAGVGERFAQALYGEHPYGREVTRPGLQRSKQVNLYEYALPFGYALTPAMVERTGMSELRAHYSAMMLPCRATVSLVGNLDRTQADAVASAALGRLPQAGCKALPALPKVQALRQASHQKLQPQQGTIWIQIGQPAVSRATPDFFPLLLGSDIFGGEHWPTRLNRALGAKLGGDVSWQSSSYFDMGQQGGAMVISLEVPAGHQQQAEEAAREALVRFVSEGPSAEELVEAKARQLEYFAATRRERVLEHVAQIALNQLPDNTLVTWQQQLEAVTPAQVQAAFAQVVQPQRLATVVAGQDQ
ncbi:M16 family metallopeptidase [Pseudomonas tructae]|nr:insulinase family protein [Pseudomonas tructae]